MTIEAGPIEPYQPLPRRLTPMTIEELLTRQFPPREMILAPWLPVKGLAMVYGPRGVGKTHLALSIAYAAAMGGALFSWRAPKPRKVLYVDGEMPAATLQERLAAIILTEGRNPLESDMIRFVCADEEPNGIPDLSTPEGQAVLDEVIEDAELIILDNISTLCRSGRENEAESWNAVQDWALAKRRDGRAAAFMHHAGKGGQQRGTSRREDVLDTVVSLRKPQDYNPAEGARFEIHFEKSRGFTGPEAEPFEATLTDQGWATKALSDVLEARVLALDAEGMKQREIASEVGKSAATVNRILKRSRGEL